MPLHVEMAVIHNLLPTWTIIIIHNLLPTWTILRIEIKRIVIRSWKYKRKLPEYMEIDLYYSNNNNNTLIYIAPACRMTSEALADSSSRATECLTEK